MNAQEEPHDYELVEKLYPDEVLRRKSIKELFIDVSRKSEELLNEDGFYTWVDRGNLGHLVAYTKAGEENVEFTIKKRIIRGKTAAFDISGKFNVDNHTVDIQIVQEEGSSMLSHYIFVDDSLFASMVDPFSETEAMALDFAKEATLGDPNRFKRAASENTQPYVKKMLGTFLESSVDVEKTRHMFDKMRNVKSGEGMVEWSKKS